MKNSNETIGDRTRDLPTYSAVPPRAPSCDNTNAKYRRRKYLVMFCTGLHYLATRFFQRSSSGFHQKQKYSLHS